MSTPTRAASPKQWAYITSLAEQVYGVEQAQEYLAGLTETLDSPRAASRVIDSLKAQAPERPEPDEGFYLVGDTIYRVQTSRQSARRYAKQLVVGDEGASWEYAGRRPFGQLSEDTRLTAEEAAAWGHHYGICAVCGATLTNEESVERGIGPVCITRL